MHDGAYRFVQRAVIDHGPFALVIECGGRNINGSVRGLFGSADYTSVDLDAGPGVDLVGDFATLVATTEDSGEDGYDAVVCCEVLEHAPDPEAILDAAHRLLRPGGLLILTCASEFREPHSGVDGGPLRSGEHYVGVSGLRLSLLLQRIFGRYEIVEVPAAGDVYALAWKKD